MTRQERETPKILDKGPSAFGRKKRIAKGSGVDVRDVNEVLEQYKQMQKMMGELKKGRFPKIPGMPNMPGF